MIEIADDLRPWVPEGAREFRVGDRVRVRLSGECRRRYRTVNQIGLVTGAGMGHVSEENGMTGVVCRRPTPPTDPTHCVDVAFDHAIFLNEIPHVAGSYAPSELELLEAADA